MRYMELFIQEQINRITNKLSGVLTKDELGIISEKLRELFADNPVDLRNIEVVVTNNPHDFAKFARTLDVSHEHSWAGYDSCTRDVTVILGDVEVGHYEEYEYYYNGNLTNDTEEEILPDFSLNTRQVILIHDITEDCWDGKNLKEERYMLVVYVLSQQEQ